MTTNPCLEVRDGRAYVLLELGPFALADGETALTVAREHLRLLNEEVWMLVRSRKRPTP